MSRIIKWIWLLSLIVVSLQPIFSYNNLPHLIAIHFDLSGRPNDWMEKTPFFIFWYFLIIITNSAAIFAPGIMGKISPSKWSIPNKSYWIETQERRQRVIGVISTTLKGTFFSVI